MAKNILERIIRVINQPLQKSYKSIIRHQPSLLNSIHRSTSYKKKGISRDVNVHQSVISTNSALDLNLPAPILPSNTTIKMTYDVPVTGK